MKKFLVILIVVVGLVGAAIYLNRTAIGPFSDDYYAAYLPQETLATVSLLDLKGLSEEFPTTALGMRFAKPAVHGVLTELGTNPEVLQGYDDFYDGLAEVLTNPAFRQVFGDDVVAALLPPDPVRLEENPEKELERSLLIFATSSVTGPVDSFARLVMSKNFSNETVDGLAMTRILLDDENQEVIYGYAEKGVLILAYAPERIVAAVRQQTEACSLQESKGFVRAGALWTDSGAERVYARAYFNLAALADLMNGFDDQTARDSAALLQGFQGISSQIIGQEGELRIINQFDYTFAALNPLVQQQYQSLSDTNQTLGLLAGKMLAYYWISTVDQESFKGLAAKVDEKQYKRSSAAMEKEFGLSLEEMVAAVGPQAGLVVRDIVSAGWFQLPRVILFLQVRDHEIVQQLVNRLRENMAAQGYGAEQHEDVNGHTIYYWTMLPLEAAQPALVLTDTMLYIANGKTSLEALLTGVQPMEEVPAELAGELGTELTATVGQSNYSTFIMRPARLADEAREAVNQLSKMLSKSKGVSIHKLMEEILTLMRSIELITATTRIKENSTRSDIVFKQVKAAQSVKK